MFTVFLKKLLRSKFPKTAPYHVHWIPVTLLRYFIGYPSQFYQNGTCLFTVINASKLYTVILHSTLKKFASSAERARKRAYFQSCWTFKQRDILETIDFFRYGL